jgi:hypothetical protein
VLNTAGLHHERNASSLRRLLHCLNPSLHHFGVTLMTKEFQGLDTPADNALQQCVDAYAADGYLPIDKCPNQYYRPFDDNEPWDCACVAIWKDANNKVWAEE